MFPEEIEHLVVMSRVPMNDVPGDRGSGGRRHYLPLQISPLYSDVLPGGRAMLTMRDWKGWSERWEVNGEEIYDKFSRSDKASPAFPRM